MLSLTRTRFAEFFRSEFSHVQKALAYTSGGFACFFIAYGSEAFRPQMNPAIINSWKLAGAACFIGAAYHVNHIRQRSEEVIQQAIYSL